MNKYMKIAAAAVLAAAMATAPVSCNSKDSSSSSKKILKSTEIPYGANMIKHQVEEGVAIQTEVDINCVTLEESKALSYYIAGIGQGNGEVFEKCTDKALLDYVVKNDGCANVDEYAKKLHEQYKTYMIKSGETEPDYDFTYVVAEKMDGEDAKDFSAFDDMVQKIIPDAEISDRKCLYIDAIDIDNGSKSLNVRMGDYLPVYIFTINGTPCVLV